MQYRLNDNLGTDDARKCNVNFGATLTLDAAKLTKGETISLPKAAVDFLTNKYKALLEPISIEAVPARTSIHGTPEKATEDLKRYKDKGAVRSE